MGGSGSTMSPTAAAEDHKPVLAPGGGAL
jgi:hypothetical protein